MESCPPERLPLLCERLLDAGYRDEDIRGVLGGN